MGIAGPKLLGDRLAQRAGGCQTLIWVEDASWRPNAAGSLSFVLVSKFQTPAISR